MDIIKKPWTYTIDDIIKHYDVTQEQGLDSHKIQKRKKQFGKNSLREKEKKSAWSILQDQVKSIIMVLLGAAALVSLLFGEIVQAIAIITVLVITIFIGFFTEIRAIRSMESLKKMSQVNAIVRREGTIQEISAKNLVPGDIVLLESGDIVTADLRLIEANNLQSDESALTGESVPVSKNIDTISEDASLEERSNMLFKGTMVTKGSAKGIVISTGTQTELGEISSLVEEAEEEITPLEHRLKVLARKLVWVTLLISAVVGMLGIFRGKELFLMIETAIALAVAAIPEGLPIVATVALASGMIQMAKKNALINRLSSVETLGSTNVIFSDKTGTLTLNKMTVTSIRLGSGTIKVENESNGNNVFKREGKKLKLEHATDLKEALQIGVLCNNASLASDNDNNERIGDPLEIALLDVGKKGNIIRHDLLEDMPEHHEEAFDPEVKMMGTIHKENGSYYVAVKGAPEAVLEHSNSFLQDDETITMDEALRESWNKKNKEMAEAGLRVISVAMKQVSSDDIELYKDLTFVGHIGLYDPPRKEVKTYIEDCKKAGIRLIMVTGDQPATARNVAKEISLVDDNNAQVIEGKDLKAYDDLTEEERNHILKQTIFARVSPKQKLDLISIHQHNNAIVAMTGDGVNDAPALKKADIGVAMGKRGTQVAQDASDMILQDDSFSSIITAVKHGRVIFSNIRKFILFLLSGNIGEITAVALASVLNFPLPISPLQILYVNLIIDVFPALALGVGRGDPNVMKRPPRDPKESFLMKQHWMLIIGYGGLIGASILASLLIALILFHMPIAQAVTISFLTLSFARLGHVFNMRDVDSSPIRNEVTENPYIWIAIGLCITLILSAVYLPGLSEILQVVDPGVHGWLLIFSMSIIPFIVGQIGLNVYKRIR